jgi:flavin reductase (DIM6/NTAB) family NADH-FMN oxidoreductase RutF
MFNQRHIPVPRYGSISAIDLAEPQPAGDVVTEGQPCWPRPAAVVSTPIPRSSSERNMAPDDFRTAMRQIPAAVTIVTTSAGGVRHGLTATAVASVSADPPQVLVCVNRGARSSVAISVAGRFGLNYLGAEHIELAEAFAAPTGDHEDRFRRARWSDSPSGTPLLLDALVAFECIVVNEIRSGTHVIFIGQVTAVRRREGRSLIYQCAAFTSPNPSAGPSWPVP